MTESDVLARIDALTSCGWCGVGLDESTSSGDFCSALCQRRWAAQHADPLPPSPDAALVLVGDDRARWTPDGAGRTAPDAPRHHSREGVLPFVGAVYVADESDPWDTAQWEQIGWVTGPPVPPPGARQGRRR